MIQVSRTHTFKVHWEALPLSAMNIDNHSPLKNHSAPIYSIPFSPFLSMHLCSALLVESIFMLCAYMCLYIFVLTNKRVCGICLLLSQHTFIMKWMGSGQGLSCRAGLWLLGYSSKAWLAVFALLASCCLYPSIRHIPTCRSTRCMHNHTHREPWTCLSSIPLRSWPSAIIKVTWITYW